MGLFSRKGGGGRRIVELERGEEGFPTKVWQACQNAVCAARSQTVCPYRREAG